jgi:excisionase family DNA binding protein
MVKMEVIATSECTYVAKEDLVKFIEEDIPDKKFFRIDEVAAYFSVGQMTIRRWIKNGILIHERWGGQIRIPRQAIINFRLNSYGANNV